MLRRKFGVPAKAVTEIESFLRGYQVQPKSRELPGLKLGDRNDLLVIGSALKGKQKSWLPGTGKCSSWTKNSKVCKL